MKIRPTILTCAAVLASAFILALALPLQAQDSQSQPQLPAQKFEPSQDQLESFASAVLQIQQIRSKWQTRMQVADSVEKTKEFQAQASSEMMSAVNETGLTVETYKAIADAARDNPELAERIVKLMEQAR
jgi:uncharacterized protein DUF4168